MSIPNHQTLKTHCPQGHPYDEANTYVNPVKGGRACRACVAVRSKARRALAGTGPAAHGAVKYKSESCRCDICKAAHREAHKSDSARRYALVAEHGLPSHVSHGETAYRDWGCRCGVCLSAASEATIRARWLKALAKGNACSFEGCTSSPKRDGLCKQHDYQLQRQEPLRPVGRGETRKSVGWITERGYRKIHDASHPNAHKSGSLYEHVKVMTEVLGRPLVEGENVHHINGVRDDNRPENLELWVTSQPSGQRPEDLVSWAWEIIRRYDTSEEGAA